jgi:hypothetical protein
MVKVCQLQHQRLVQELGMEYAGGVAGRYTTAVTAQQSAFQNAGQQLQGYNAGLVQQTEDAANVVTGAQQIGKAYGLTIPQAMALAQSAGVSLTGAVKNSNGQWTVAGQKVAAAEAGPSCWPWRRTPG